MRSTGPDSSFSRLAMEFVVIVAGVLAALAVDQWMQSRQDRVLERELLQNLALDLLTDSADYARLPERALGRVTAAETLLLDFRPGAPRSMLARAAVDTLGPFARPVSDSALVRAFGALVTSSDLDVADGAYREFAEGGGQRLVRSRTLRRMIHEYRYNVVANVKYDPRVSAATTEVQRRAHDLGLSPGDSDATLIRERLSTPEAEPFFAAVRTLQHRSAAQNRIGGILLARASTLLEAIRAELGDEGSAAI